MSQKIQPIKTELSRLLSDSLHKTLGGSFPPAELEAALEVPREEKFGDLTTSIVLKLSKEKKTASQAMHRNAGEKYGN